MQSITLEEYEREDFTQYQEECAAQVEIDLEAFAKALGIGNIEAFVADVTRKIDMFTREVLSNQDNNRKL